MRISFDVDDTLVCGSSVPTEPAAPWWARPWFHERLRRGTRDLMRALLERRCKLWIYTTSYRSPAYLRWWFRTLGVRLEGAVNQDIHDQMVKLPQGPYYPPSKFPPAFQIDLHIDDSEGVAIEGRRFHFDVVVVSPSDLEWTSRVLAAVDRRLSCYNRPDILT
jgi:hypothetical protein